MNRKEFGGTPLGQFRKGRTITALDERFVKDEIKRMKNRRF